MMSLWFYVSLAGFILIVPVYFLSVEHWKLRERFGRERGERIGDILGYVSGWGLFIFWFGIWVSPQTQFKLGLVNFGISLPFGIGVSLDHLVLSLVFLVPGVWLGFRGVLDLSLRVSETHRPLWVVSSGVYSRVRHPQYLAGLLGHAGASLLLGSWCSLASAPIVIMVILFISWKEEVELVREFGREYEDYRERVPMFVPRFKWRK